MTWTGTGTGIASGAGDWTPTTLCAHLIGEVNQDMNAAGGDIPARMMTLVKAAYRDLWNMHEWRFRKRRETLTIAASAYTADCPSDFEKLDQKWMEENNSHGTLWFTADLQAFENRQSGHGSTPGTPEIALVEPDSDLTGGYAEVFRVSPTALSEFTYPYVYLCYAPTLGDTDSPLWPQPWYTAWEFGARARAYYDFRCDKDAWKGPYNHFQGLVVTLKDKNDEYMVSSTPMIRDQTGDWDALASTAWLRGGL